MFVLGLTGGIGSGKSVVANLFSDRGVNIIDADLASRVVVKPGQPALKEIVKHFGDEILDASGNLNRAKLRQLIFEDEIERVWLEQLLHPLIRAEIQSQLSRSTSPYAILASPLLIETRQHEMVQHILVVDAPEELQLQRSMNRDGSDENQIRAIMAAQTTRQQRLSLADDVIINDSELQSLSPIVKTLHEKYLELAQDH